MKRIIVLFIIFTCSVFGAEINWVKDYNAALTEAKNSSKSIFMVVEKEDCFFCGVYKEKTLSLSTVAKFINENYIPLKVMQDDGSYPSDKFNVIGTPTTFFIDKDGNKYISPLVGYANKYKLMKKLEQGLFTK